MGKNRWTKMLLMAFMAFSLVTTSVGGAFATAALAAEPEETQEASTDSGGSKAAIGGLLALGLITMLAKGGDSGGNTADAGKTPAPAPQPKPAPAPAPKPAPAPQPKPAPAPAPKPTPAPQPKPSPAPVPSPTPSGLTADEQKAVDLLNADRAANGLPPLRVNLKLTGLARDYAQDMINRNFFSHYNPEGKSPFDRMRAYGIRYGYAGENLAINSSVAGAERAFMNSPGHRANILNSHYTQVGIGVRYSPRGSVYVVQEFTDG